MIIKAIKRLIKLYPYKWFLNFRGYFIYFEQKIFFPKNSTTFICTLQDGIYESKILTMITANCKPNTYYFDIGTNIGTLSIPVLATISDVKVVSIEASPNTLPYLNKTFLYSDYKNRWVIIPKAVSSHKGIVDFTLSSKDNGAFESIADTKRVVMEEKIKIEATTIDIVWADLGNPIVSVIKFDIEGADLLALKGAYNCIITTQPIIIFEWNKQNISAFGFTSENLFEFINSISYQLYSLPDLISIPSSKKLEQHTILTENFVLLPF